MLSHLHATARTLAERGLAVLPCLPRDKRPATQHGVKDAGTDPGVIDNWWQANPDYNLAVATGAPSNLFVVDIDGDDGEASMRALEAEHGELPPTVESITGNGRHCFFRLNGHAIRNSVGQIGNGIDIRSTGGYVLVPTSIHPTGRRYEWSVDSANQPADPPQWLVEKLVGPGAMTAPLRVETWENVITREIHSGGRNNALTKLAGHLLRFNVDPHLALELVRSINMTHCRPALDEAEVTRIVESVAGMEARRRRLQGVG